MKATIFHIGAAMQRREKILRPEADSEKSRRGYSMSCVKKYVTPLKTPRTIGGLSFGQAQATANTSPAIIDALMGPVQTKAVALPWLLGAGNHGYHCGPPLPAPRCRTRLHPRRGRAHTRNRHHQILLALWNAAALGANLITNASVSGAEGGCQAEIDRRPP